MIELEVNNSQIVEIDYEAGMTKSNLQTKFQDHTPGKHYRLNQFDVYDPSQNRKLVPTDVIVDNRRYTATVWVQSVVDDEGNKLTTGLT